MTSATETSHQETADGGLSRWPVALLLASASFLVLFDSLALATALPSIGADFRLRPGSLQWVISLYSLSIGAFLVLGGRVSDLWGRRRTLLASLALCTAAGLVAGLAPGLPLLLAGRVLQGLAAAFAIPAALATAATVFPEEPWKSRVFSVIAFAAWSAGLAGAMLGGLITAHLGWRWVLLLTVPVAAAAFAAAATLLPPDPPRRGAGERLDVGGALLASGGLVALILGLQQLTDDRHTVRSVLIACLGLVLLGGLVVVERRVTHPLVKLGLLRSRRITGSFLAFGAYCAGYSAVIVLGSLYLQDVHGLSATAAGLTLSPVLVGGIVSSSLSSMVLRRFGARAVLTPAFLLCALALTVVTLLGTADVVVLAPWLVLWGIASGPIYVALTSESIGIAAEEDRGTVSALFESMSHVGGGVAVAVYLTMLDAGAGYRAARLLGAVSVALGAVLVCLLLSGRDRGRPNPVLPGRTHRD
ncbi:MFS transporter [Actinoallomurus sp. CA-142502]|uniref:MFS transporter n=1 Tax=Actinoallomurus sp. CA-142502 TaxID=3239885 RepID=UPI003D93A7D4